MAAHGGNCELKAFWLAPALALDTISAASARELLEVWEARGLSSAMRGSPDLSPDELLPSDPGARVLLDPAFLAVLAPKDEAYVGILKETIPKLALGSEHATALSLAREGP